MQQRFVYFFDDGRGDLRELLGGKGANLADMADLGLPVPEGFTVTAEACVRSLQDEALMDGACWQEIAAALNRLEEATGRMRGDTRHPLLLAIRPGARVPMPGLMDAVLFLGMNDDAVEGLASETHAEYAWSCYLLFLRSYGRAVLGVSDRHFETLAQAMLCARGVTRTEDLPQQDLETLVAQFRAVCRARGGADVPADFALQLYAVMKAAFRSWNSPRACAFRRDHHLPDDWGVAVNVQRMVFSDAGKNCGAGVVYPREPATGSQTPAGEFRVRAGVDALFAGERAPLPLSEMELRFPDAFQELTQAIAVLDRRYRGLRDVRFVVEKKKLFLLRAHVDLQTAQKSLPQTSERRDGQASAAGEAAAGFDASLDYAAYPTLGMLPAEVRAAQQALKADWAAGKNEYGDVDAGKRRTTKRLP